MAATVDLTRVFREESGRALATVARLVGDIEIAEDAVQDAFAEALRTWPVDGAPRKPGAWITTVARNRAIDRLRRDSLRGSREEDAFRQQPEPDESAEVVPVEDDQLRLIFTCCHPALSVQSQVALTLRLVCGLTTTEISRAFLQPESTVGQRRSRAKAKIRNAGIPLRLPSEELLPERLPVVLSCVYLVFTEGYSSTAGEEGVRGELCDEALRLGRLLCELMPTESEVWGLTALMCLQDSRRRVRLDDAGEAVPLDEQDRGRWDRAKISEGLARLAVARERGGGRYVTEATIAAAHAVAPTFADTDWTVIVAGYDRLLELGDSPPVRVNRAVAVGFRDGPDAGLQAVAAVGAVAQLDHAVTAVRADLLRRAGRRAEAVAEYRRAVPLARTASSRRFLERRLAELDSV
ncbi:RNA polymerase sigma factor [Prescottella agglutinans]|uniref:RNA polymerase sigma-70 factor (ECF subfamily) n=1 Tax=Prescottella agglutinans TaxID=1644129 RepID=A0ABT6MHC8_9NOCA|nr:sigma-70 family RNA polymerase sigma factor [Prescottella agglutinans]MDH6283718.1 RNA polymerase sigma-70 factor (ECF subfamily) [Prescottella agglutinans]